MRGALVRSTPAYGARANLLRVGDRSIIGVAPGLSSDERRWAIAHELGHFEAHAGLNGTGFVGLCSSEDMLPSYRASGLEPEANAFAEELLMPEDLFAKASSDACTTAGGPLLSWEPIEQLASSFGVSLAAAAIRFV